MPLPLWPDHENFLQATLYEKVRFLPFSSKFQKKWANLRLLLNVQKQKVFQLQGGFALLPPRPRALPLDPAGGSAPRPPEKMGEFAAYGGDLGTADWDCLAGRCASLCLQAAHGGRAAGGSG